MKNSSRLIMQQDDLFSSGIIDSIPVRPENNNYIVHSLTLCACLCVTNSQRREKRITSRICIAAICLSREIGAHPVRENFLSDFAAAGEATNELRSARARGSLSITRSAHLHNTTRPGRASFLCADCFLHASGLFGFQLFPFIAGHSSGGDSTIYDFVLLLCIAYVNAARSSVDSGAGKVKLAYCWRKWCFSNFVCLECMEFKTNFIWLLTIVILKNATCGMKRNPIIWVCVLFKIIKCQKITCNKIAFI